MAPCELSNYFSHILARYNRDCTTCKQDMEEYCMFLLDLHFLNFRGHLDRNYTPEDLLVLVEKEWRKKQMEPMDESTEEDLEYIRNMRVYTSRGWGGTLKRWSQ